MKNFNMCADAALLKSKYLRLSPAHGVFIVIDQNTDLRTPVQCVAVYKQQCSVTRGGYKATHCHNLGSVYPYTYDGTVDNGSTRLTRTYRGPSQSERSNVITKLLSSIDCWIHLPFPTLTTYDALNIEQ